VFYRSNILVKFTGRDCGSCFTGSNFMSIIRVVFSVSLLSNLRVDFTVRVYGKSLRSSLFDRLTDRVYESAFWAEFSAQVYGLNF